MKLNKTIVLLSVFVIALLLAGCGQKEAEKQTAQTASQQTASPDTTGIDASVVQQEQQDLSTDELSDIDSGLGAIENI